MQMKRKIGYRLAHIFLVLLGVSFLSFLLMYVSPGDPVRAMYAVSGSIPSEEVLEQTREELGLNDPFFIQYGNWISNCLRGDFGTSYSKGEAVATLLMERVMPTIQLALLSLVIMVLVAVPIGVYSALRQNSILDYLLRGTTFISISMPNFWVGLLLLYVVAMKLGWLPVVSNQMNFQRLILPAVTLAIAMAGKYARQVRAAILEELRQDYVAGARARGCRNDACSGAMCFQTLFCPHHHAGAVFWALCWAEPPGESSPSIRHWAAWRSPPPPPHTLSPLTRCSVVWFSLIFCGPESGGGFFYNRLLPR